MTFSERLWAPWWWWIIGAVMAASVGLAVWAFLGDDWGRRAAWAAAVVVFLGLFTYGSFLIQVDERGLTVGRSLLEWEWIGEVEVADESRTAELLGPGGDRRAWLVTRPYVRTSVAVTVTDKADPHPYWLISTRRPAALAGALKAGTAAQGADQ